MELAGAENSQKSVCAISADTFRRIYLLAIIAGFSRGVYGGKRLQKVTYLTERKRPSLRPFEFKKYIYGQFSETLEEVKEQLISLGLIAALPLHTSMKMTTKLDDRIGEWLEGGLRYVVTDQQAVASLLESFLAMSPELVSAIRSTIKEFGYLPEQELIERCYDLPEFKKTDFEELLLEANLPAKVETTNLNEDSCEELDMALSPNFIVSMKRIADGLEDSRLDIEKVAKGGVPV